MGVVKIMTDRKAIRRLLWRWGRVLDYCAARQREIAGFLALIDEAAEMGPPPPGWGAGRSGPGDPTGRAAMRMDELIRRYRGEVARLMAACDREMAFMAAMDEVLDQLPGDQRRVVELRYKLGHRWEYIAIKLCFSVQHVKRLESLAIEAIGENIIIQKYETK